MVFLYRVPVLGRLLQQPFLMSVSSLKILLYKFAVTPIQGVSWSLDEGMICGFGGGHAVL